MPRKKKHPSEWTTEEAIHKLFPRKVVKHLKKSAADPEKSSKKRIS